MSPAVDMSLLVLALEARGLHLSVSGRGWKIFAFYTQLSNLMTAFSSVMLLLFRQGTWLTCLRYLSVCMMVMTFFVTACVLIPMGGDPKKLLWSGSGVYHHVLCPLLTALS